MCLQVYARRELPAYGAVYFVFRRDRLLYIGATENLRSRWRTHKLRHLPDDLITWVRSDGATDRALMERRLIGLLRPPLNKAHNPSSYVRRNIRRSGQTIYVAVGADVKRQAKRACRLEGISLTRFVCSAIDKEIAQLATVCPELRNATDRS